MSATRRAVFAAPLAVAALAAPAAAQSPILAQAHRVAALYVAETEAFERACDVEGTPAHAQADAAVDAVYAAWGEEMLNLAAMPAATAQDIVAKLAAALWSLRDGPGDQEQAMATALMGDIWRVCPELRPVLRWTPDKVPAQA